MDNECKRILSLVWFKIYPPYFGGQKGIAFFNKHLADHFMVDCLCSANNEMVVNAGCTIIPNLPITKTQFFNPWAWRKIIKQLNKEDYSFLILEQPYYGLLAPFLKQKKRKLIIHTHNIESQRFKSLGKKTWRFLFAYEKWCLQKADLVVFKTENEKQSAIQNFNLKAAACYVLPYGIEDARPFDKEEARAYLCKQYNIKKEETIILFAATLDYQPNAEAVKKIYFKIEPLLQQKLPAFKIIICGRNQFARFSYLKKYQNENIIQVGFVENIEPYFAGSDILIDPVQNVHGVQTKLFDALNYNLNTVCFEAAAKELPSYLNKKILVCPDGNDNEFANAILTALNSDFDTPEEFYNSYGWKNILKEFVHYLKQHQT